MVSDLPRNMSPFEKTQEAIKQFNNNQNKQLVVRGRGVTRHLECVEKLGGWESVKQFFGFGSASAYKVIKELVRENGGWVATDLIVKINKRNSGIFGAGRVDTDDKLTKLIGKVTGKISKEKLPGLSERPIARGSMSPQVDGETKTSVLPPVPRRPPPIPKFMQPQEKASPLTRFDESVKTYLDVVENRERIRDLCKRAENE